MHRWKRVHANRHVRVRDLHRSEPGDVLCVGSVPRCRELRPDYGRLFKPNEGGWDFVQRWKPVHADRHVRVRDLHGCEPCDVLCRGSVPRCWELRSDYGRLFQPSEGGWEFVQRRERLHADRHVRGRDLHGSEPGDVLCFGSVPRCRELRSEHRRVFESFEG